MSEKTDILQLLLDLQKLAGDLFDEFEAEGVVVTRERLITMGALVNQLDAIRVGFVQHYVFSGRAGDDLLSDMRAISPRSTRRGSCLDQAKDPSRRAPTDPCVLEEGTPAHHAQGRHEPPTVPQAGPREVTEIAGFKLKPFPCPNCKHDIFVGRIKLAPEEDGLHEVGTIADVTGLPIAQAILNAQKDNT